jgi:hypothetical protein
MDVEETHKFCSHFKISMDHLLHLQNDTFVFSGKLNVAGAENAFGDWLQEVKHPFEVINGFRMKLFYLLTKDIPFFSFPGSGASAFRFF